jgi:CheY-like chemotaxis protein
MFASFSNSSIPLSEGGYAHIFMASMGASRYAFACATMEETAIASIRSANRALHFYGGVPRLIIPEGSNGTIPSDRASENTMVLHFARHYGTSVLLSLLLDPKQRTQAALPVEIIERWILRCLRQRKFATIEDVEAALQPWLDRLNHHLFRNLPASRASAFAKLDSPALSPLPAQHYEIPVSVPDLTSTEIRRPGLNNESRAKVLVAESDIDMRAYLEQLFGKQYQVISVRDGRSALQAALEHEPELVLSGLARPEPDGLDLLGALRAQAATSPIAFIQLLDTPDGNAHEQGMRAEADDWIAKSPSGRELLSKARAMLALTKCRRAARRREEQLQVATLDILEGLSELFLMVDSEWRIRYLDTAAETAAHLPRCYFLGRNY